MNISMNSEVFASLYQLNRKMDSLSTVLSTGKTINSAADDLSGFVFTERLTTRMNGFKSANANIDQAKYILDAVKAGVQSGLTVLNNMKNLAIASQDPTKSSTARLLLQEQFNNEIQAYVDLTEKFQVNGKNFLGSGQSYTPVNVGISTFYLRPAYIDYNGEEGVTFNTESIETVSDATAMRTLLDKNIDILKSVSESIGNQLKQLDFYKEYNTNQAVTAETAYASKMTADIAKTQSEFAKLSLLENSNYTLLQLFDQRAQNLIKYISS